MTDNDDYATTRYLVVLKQMSEMAAEIAQLQQQVAIENWKKNWLQLRYDCLSAEFALELGHGCPKQDERDSISRRKAELLASPHRPTFIPDDENPTWP